MITYTWRSHPAAQAESALTKWQENQKEYTQVPEQYLILVTCATEREQVELLRRWHAEGLECKALVG